MKKSEVNRFAKIISEADKINRATKKARFFPMQKSARNGFLIEIGLYDGKTKQYELVDTRHYTVNDVITNMEEMITSK